jgi:hypothetical protein
MAASPWQRGKQEPFSAMKHWHHGALPVVDPINADDINQARKAVHEAGMTGFIHVDGG